ncbi:integrase catalytic domain-containing protein, partial [Trichonephila clavipes]
LENTHHTEVRTVCSFTTIEISQKVVPILQLPINKIWMWTDSTIALAWIKTEPHKLKTIVSNRVAEIKYFQRTIIGNMFINNIKAKESCNKEKYLTADEVKRSTEFLAKIAQLGEFKAEIDALKKLKWARHCLACQKSKIHRHTRSPLSSFQESSQRFHHVHLDLIGPLPPSNGYTYCLTMIDRFSEMARGPTPLKDITAETVAEAFFSSWVSRFGTPAILTTDRGRQFESSLFKALSKLLGVQKCRTTGYHPQANRMIEELHRPLKVQSSAMLLSVGQKYSLSSYLVTSFS